MNLFVLVLFVVALVLVLGVGVVASQVRRSDAAGNGLGEVWLVMTMGGAWLLVVGTLVVVALRAPQADGVSDVPWGRVNVGSAVVVGFALAAQWRSLSRLLTPRSGGWLRVLQLVGLVVVPLICLAHAAWRGLGLPLPVAFATWGCAGLVVAFSLLPWLRSRAAAPARRAAPEVDTIRYPAVLLHERDLARVLSQSDDLRALRADLLPVRRTPVVIDSSLAIYQLRDLRLALAGAPGLAFTLFEDAASAWFPDARDLLLREGRFADDAGQEQALRARLAAAASMAEIIAILRAR